MEKMSSTFTIIAVIKDNNGIIIIDHNDCFKNVHPHTLNFFTYMYTSQVKCANYESCKKLVLNYFIRF